MEGMLLISTEAPRNYEIACHPHRSKFVCAACIVRGSTCLERADCRWLAFYLEMNESGSHPVLLRSARMVSRWRWLLQPSSPVSNSCIQKPHVPLVPTFATSPWPCDERANKRRFARSAWILSIPWWPPNGHISISPPWPFLASCIGFVYLVQLPHPLLGTPTCGTGQEKVQFTFPPDWKPWRLRASQRRSCRVRWVRRRGMDMGRSATHVCRRRRGAGGGKCARTSPNARRNRCWWKKP